MKLQKVLTVTAVAAAMFALSHLAIAQSPNEPADSQTGSQSGQGSAHHPMAEQGGSDDTTLEIAPQPGAIPPKPAIQEIPTDRDFHPDEENVSVDPNFRPGLENGTGNTLNGNDSYRPRQRPYLGITVQYDTQCYDGKEEHGLEVLTIDPNSPAAAAGLQARTGMNPVGAAVATLSGIIPGGEILANKALSNSGAMGHGGDLIVAVDDRRVRDQSDLETAMAHLKPGDTMYLTVLRPQPPHQSVKIAVKVGAVGEPIANAAPMSGGGYTH